MIDPTPIEKATINTLAVELFEIRKLIKERSERRFKCGNWYLGCGGATLAISVLSAVAGQVMDRTYPSLSNPSGCLLLVAMACFVIGIGKQIEQ